MPPRSSRSWRSRTRAKDDDDTVPGGDDTFSFTSYNLGLGLLFHFSADRTRAQTFLRPFAGVSGSRSDGGSASQPFLGAALGLKTANADRLAARFEAGFEHRFEDDPGFESSNRIFLSLGFSFFTR